MATGSTKLPHRTVSDDWVGGQYRKVKDNTVPAGRDYIGDARRGVMTAQYREGINLPGAAKKKNSAPGLRSRDDGGLHNSSSPMTKYNRPVNKLGKDLGDSTLTP